MKAHNNAINTDSQTRRFALLLSAGYGERWRGRFAPRHRGCGLSSAFSPALRAGHQAAAADGRPREQARASVRR